MNIRLWDTQPQRSGKAAWTFDRTSAARSFKTTAGRRRAERSRRPGGSQYNIDTLGCSIESISDFEKPHLAIRAVGVDVFHDLLANEMP